MFIIHHWQQVFSLALLCCCSCSSLLHLAAGQLASSLSPDSLGAPAADPADAATHQLLHLITFWTLDPHKFFFFNFLKFIRMRQETFVYIVETKSNSLILNDSFFICVIVSFVMILWTVLKDESAEQ